MSTQISDEVAFSDLLRRQREVAYKAARGKGVLLRRRDAEDLFLTSAARMETAEEGFSVVTKIFASLMKEDDGARTLLLAMPEVFPWVRYLSAEEVREFLVEITQTVRACDELGNLTPVATVVKAWRSTAEAYADPELRDALTERDVDDAGPVSPDGDL
ncbi:DUF6247 family protein [Streptomonospora litoralis]|uniref:Prevent-host-death family protein n=1 Tax=Streptomonospora litoralis TaxID=2498135 RepID=A0A4P6Q8F3_9ACTN|nr:DUF6247 family protein [Streptomonospora litoralis]QBI55354.1 hypothetical protein EKD16_17950 [Streptomonospora litoralis]